jgi:hypothetical protein
MYILVFVSIFIFEGEAMAVGNMDFPVATLEECLDNRKKFFEELGSEDGSPVINTEAICVKVEEYEPAFWTGVY